MELITNKDRVLDTLSKLPNISNKELYALYPKVDQGSIRNYKHLFNKSITNGINNENSESVITPDKKKKKKSKVSTKKEMKELFHEDTFDSELIGMNDSELIRHTCREIISTKKNDSRIKLQASTLLLNFIDKSGLIKDSIPNKHQELRKKFRSMPVDQLIAILNNDTRKRGFMKIKEEEALGYIVSKEGRERLEKEGGELLDD